MASVFDGLEFKPHLGVIGTRPLQQRSVAWSQGPNQQRNDDGDDDDENDDNDDGAA